MVSLLVAWVLPAHAQLLGPRVQLGGFMNNPAPAVLDLTRDQSPDLHFTTVLGVGFTLSLDEEAGALASGTHGALLGAPAYPSGSLAFPTAITAVDLNSDQKKDVVIVTNSGALMTAINAGTHRLNAGAFLSPVVEDWFGPSMAINPPFVNFSVPVLRTVDVDGDQRTDIVFGIAPVDVWAGLTQPGVLYLYRSNASGGYQRDSLPIPGNTIDLEWADLDSNGAPDHLVLVTETGAVGAFSYELHHAAYSASLGLHFTNSSQYLPMRVTSLELMDASGTGAADYIFPTTTPGAAGGPPVLYVYEGDGQGNLGAWAPLYLPTPTSLLRESILSVKSADFNSDGFADLAVLRSYCQPSSGSIGNAYDDAQVEIFYGPGLASGTPQSLPVGGYVQDLWSTHPVASLLPMRSMPELLTPIDLGGDEVSDLTVTHAFGRLTPTSSLVPLLVTYRSSTVAPFGHPGFFKVGDPSGPAPDNKGRAGFEGEPRVGNQNFRGTISNVAPGSLLGYVWGPVGIPYLFQQYGIDAHIAPAHYGYMKIADATGFGSYDLPIPNNPALIGDAGFFQWAFWNPATSHFGGTQATQVIIGQ